MNLQNIPSTPRKLTTGEKIDAGHDVRQFFSAAPGCVMLSCDYSGQEVRVTAHVANDKKMIQAYRDNKDVYVEIASLAFHKPYEECLENRPDGTTNPDGKARRGASKKIVLGILYGRQIKSIAEQLNTTVQEAQKIYDSVLANFPDLAEFIQQTQQFAREHGYVCTVWGRRRQLPDMQLPLYEFTYANGVNPEFDPLVDDEETSAEVPLELVEQYTNELINGRGYKQKLRIIDSLKAQGIDVVDNTKKVSDAERQCVNCVDFNTEILTVNGWKKYNEVQKGDTILSYNMLTQNIEKDIINDVYIYNDTFDCVEFKHQNFSAVSTLEHRWVTQKSTNLPKFVTTEKITKRKYPDFPILKVADNNFAENESISDNQLKLLGWLLTDGSFSSLDKFYRAELYQSCNKPKNAEVYNDMINTLKVLNIPYTDRIRNENYHEIYLYQCDFIEWVRNTFVDKVLTYDFVSTLSQRQANILMNAMLQADGCYHNTNYVICCANKQEADIFQYLCFIAGKSTSCHERVDLNKHYGKVVNEYVQATKPYYQVAILNRKRVHIYTHHRINVKVDGVWCVNTNNSTWIARRNGYVYITGNSVVQGSAADLTKLAMIELYNNQELRDLGFKMLIPVHDEIIAECPVENSARCAELMSQCMLNAGKDLCVPLKCDTDAFYHWYGDKLDPVTLEPLGEH